MQIPYITDLLLIQNNLVLYRVMSYKQYYPVLRYASLENKASFLTFACGKYWLISVLQLLICSVFQVILFPTNLIKAKCKKCCLLLFILGQQLLKRELSYYFLYHFYAVKD